MRARFRFEKLTIWQDARALNKRIYRLSRSFPQEELYGLTSQLRRASVSISSNIAEGSGRNSDKDFAHFLELGYASGMEVASLVFLALDQTYITEAETNALLADLEKLTGGIGALNRSLQVSGSKTRFVRPAQDPPGRALGSRLSTLDNQ